MGRTRFREAWRQPILDQEILKELLEAPTDQRMIICDQYADVRPEFEVLQCIAQGRRLTDIAEQLNLSIKTVSTYRTRLLTKLGLETTAELVRYALDQQLV